MVWFVRATKFFLLFWIILIPSSLSYHYNEASGLVKGVLVDYRIPIISASALALTAFLICLLISLRVVGKREKFLMSLGRFSAFALIISFMIQVSLGLFQFRFQRSATRYLPLGEVDYSSPQIAKGTFFSGQIYKLPYGTTNHPNILAGFIVVSFLLLAVQQFMTIRRRNLALLFIVSATLCFLTQSLTASLALWIGSLILLAYKTRLTKVIRLGLILFPLFSVLLFSLPQALNHPDPSISRRAQLQKIALKMIQAQPIGGVGWNNFTLYQEDYGYIPSTTRFLQPIHHSYLLLIVELGLMGWGLNLLFHLFVLRVHPLWLPVISALVVIASLDHYPVTLSIGRMLFLLIVLMVLLHKSKPKTLII